MNGVEILSMTEVATESISNWWAAGIIFIAFVIGGAVAGFFLYNVHCDLFEKFLDAVLFGLLGAMFGLVAWIMVVAATSTPISYETQYKVTINDSVSMNEFLEKYEIVDQEGKIYTVREKD